MGTGVLDIAGAVRPDLASRIRAMHRVRSGWLCVPPVSRFRGPAPRPGN